MTGYATLPAHRPPGTDKQLPVEKIDEIADAFGRVFVLERVAGLVEESSYHVKKWVKRGKLEFSQGLDTSYAQLFLKVNKSLSKKAEEFLNMLNPKTARVKGIIWKLEHCLRSDYATESEEYKELVVLYEKLLNDQKALLERLPQGATKNGQEMDPKGD